ncbi:MAG TPA: hypothetical protein VFF78_01735 [Anaerolineaceae bacterium]|nr:hypothetical protein [Anaerolineaceae bacterium]
MEPKTNWKTNTWIIGALIGLVSGLFAAYMLIKRAEAEDQKPKITPGDGVKVGLGMLSVFKVISDLGAAGKK